MAKLSAHGSEIGTIYGMTTAQRFMSDGKILKNLGVGWKLHATVKTGLAPADCFAQSIARQNEKLAQRPAYAAYRAELHDMAGLSKRWKLHKAIQLMPEDADGVWSEACDSYSDNVSASVDEISKLCQLYLAAVREAKARKESVAA